VTADPAELDEDVAEPVVTDLGPILRRGPARVLRLPSDAIREDSLTVYELVTIGRALGISPVELTDAVRAIQGKRAGWESFEIAQAFAWIVARRAEPGLTWEEARTFGLDVVAGPEPDPTSPPDGRKRPQNGQHSP
jgi:hypothetical protein